LTHTKLKDRSRNRSVSPNPKPVIEPILIKPERDHSPSTASPENVRSIMENPDTERIKCSWNDDKRFVWISKTATVIQLHQAISDKYNLPVEVGQIKFRDPTEPNDLMTISSQEDMEIFFSSHYKEVFITRQTPPLSPNFTHRYSLNSNPELMGHKLCRCSPLFFDFANSYNTESPPWIIHSSELRIPVDTPPLGCGYFGEVRLGYWRRRKVACKKNF